MGLPMYIRLCALQRLVLNVFLSQSSHFLCCHGTLRWLLQLVNLASSPLGNCFSSTGFPIFMSKLEVQTLVFVLGQQALHALSCFLGPSPHSAVTFSHFILAKPHFYFVFAKHNFQLLPPSSRSSHLMLCWSSVFFFNINMLSIFKCPMLRLSIHRNAYVLCWNIRISFYLQLSQKFIYYIHPYVSSIIDITVSPWTRIWSAASLCPNEHLEGWSSCKNGQWGDAWIVERLHEWWWMFSIVFFCCCCPVGSCKMHYSKRHETATSKNKSNENFKWFKVLHLLPPFNENYNLRNYIAFLNSHTAHIIKIQRFLTG